MVTMTAQQDDTALARRAAGGDRAAFEQLVGRYTGPLLELCRQLLRDRSAAEDVVQETLLRLFQHLPGHDPQKRLGAWLYKVAQNLCFDLLRKRKRIRPLPEVEPQAAAPLDGPDCERLDGAIAQLCPKYRAVLHYKYRLGMNAREIAEQLDLRPADVRVCLHRAIRILRERLT